jgi:thymidine kinase
MNTLNNSDYSIPDNAPSENECGRLEVLFGPMFSCKSTTLMTIYKKFKLKYNVLIVNNRLDKRSGNNIVATHDKQFETAICLNQLSDFTKDPELKAMYKFTDVIMIDEAQFFTDLKEFVLEAVEKDGKMVFVFGLSGTFKREKFGQIFDLIPYADKVSHLKAICHYCEGVVPAPFTKRIVDNESEILVGAEDSYVAVCRKHYLY